MTILRTIMRQLKQSSHMQEIGSPLVYASLDTFRFGDYNSLKLK